MIASSCPYNQRLLLHKQITHSNGTFGVADGCRGWKKYKTQTVLQLCVMIVNLGLMSEKKDAHDCGNLTYIQGKHLSKVCSFLKSGYFMLF